MSRRIMWNLITLDGFFEGAKRWDLGWHERVWGEELERLSIEQLRSADGLLFGRVTYEGMAAHWPSAEGEVAELMNGIPKVVISRTLEKTGWQNTRLVNGDAVAEVSRLKAAGNRNTFVFGSGDLSATLTRCGLFDEYRLVVVPVVLGTGKTLFGRGFSQPKLTLLEARPLSSGAVIVRYEPDRSE
jgi:dihydrofolate reductase